MRAGTEHRGSDGEFQKGKTTATTYTKREQVG